jgi:hypothetical protein
VGTLSDAKNFCSKLQQALQDPLTTFEEPGSVLCEQFKAKEGKDAKKKGIF